MDAAACCKATAARGVGDRSTNGRELADIIRRYGPAYRRGNRLSGDQNKTLNAIEACRTAELGGHAKSCLRCGYKRYSYNSCRNRHCPKCQTLTKACWIEDRKAELLPAPYFHVVFSLPHELNGLFLYNRRTLIDLLFSAASRTLGDFGRNNLGGRLGFTMILHTWDQQLNAHFHLHCLIAGGALVGDDAASRRWGSTGPKFLLPVPALSKVFRGKFLAGLKAIEAKGELTFPAAPGNAREFTAMLGKLYGKRWNLYAKPPFGGPERTLEYLGRYTHRVAISNSRILSIDNGTVRFKYRDRRDHDRIKIKSLAASEFIRRFLLHVLPTGLMRIRHFGFLASRCKTAMLAQCRRALGVPEPQPRLETPQTAAQWMLALTGIDIEACPRCGHRPLQSIELPPINPHHLPPLRGPPDTHTDTTT
ncbi:MAG: IS91 family transposase [SAR202 cluster bacterium]|jgi:hypothetical protein|nr:IS91 family transposase [SAR202 cluster bacterium]